MVQEYIREIGACLIQLEQQPEPVVQSLMEKLTVESSRIIGCVKLLNHDVHNAMLAGKLDPGLGNTHKLGAAFYTNLTVSLVHAVSVLVMHCAVILLLVVLFRFCACAWRAAPWL